jgi:Cdc6-like AAA superfamily ATPase
MSNEIKASAIPAAGYVYQTMQGINVLCDWLDSPSRYARIRFECDDDAVSPQGLDDVVAQRADGRFDIRQVKFTPSPDKYSLDWDWLLTKSGGAKSRSLLRKWFDALNAIDPANLGSAQLLTNRIPDLEMEGCLQGGDRIDHARASSIRQKRVEQELGGHDNAKRFFAAFAVQHSDKGFVSIELHVTQRLRRHATAEGVEALKNRAIAWSIVKNQPDPDGWITFDTLQSTLRLVAPEPLPEDFAVPQGYIVPDTPFHAAFMAGIEAVPGQPIVLTGPPGRGKSTYLSKVCELLQNNDVPIVRHHYFLSSSDRAVDRHSPYVVEQSLIRQVTDFHSDIGAHDPDLRSTLCACAAHYKAKGKPFVVIVDGLDHVWRNQAHDRRSLDDIFNQLLPGCENLVLVVGTQPVDDEQLPSRLIAQAPRSGWLELPAMSANAVLQYLRKEVQQGRLIVQGQKPYREEALQDAAAEMRVRTEGHPLHVIYATEELVRTGRELSKWNVEQLTGDLSGDVKRYYASLWALLGASQKDALRVICEFPFFWPRTAFREIAALAGAPEPPIPAIEHLLHASAAGLRPFHESLIVFVRQTDGYHTAVVRLTDVVERWLDTTAPQSLRVNWLWSVKARRGYPDDLIQGLQRDWVLARLEEGYPTTLFDNLFRDAEEAAVQATRYADAYRLRHLKYRLLNSMDYQLTGADASRLRACTWALAPDAGVVNEAIASRQEGSVIDLAALSLALAVRGDRQTATRCAEEALRRHRGESRFLSQSQGSERTSRMLFLARALYGLGVLDRSAEQHATAMETDWSIISLRLLQACVERGLLRKLFDIGMLLSDGKAKASVCDAIVRAAALAEADITAWSEFSQLNNGSLIGCAHALAGDDVALIRHAPPYKWFDGGYDESRAALVELAHDWFFEAARLHLLAGDRHCHIKAPAFESRSNVSAYFDQLAQIARDVAQRWSDGKAVPFSFLYEAFSVVKYSFSGRSYDEAAGTRSFRRALHATAIDIQLLRARFGQSPLVSMLDLEQAMAQPWFDTDEFRAQYIADFPKALSDDAAEHFIRRQLATFDASVGEETGVRMMAMLELCEMAIRHGLMPVGSELCRRIWELVLGYGQRKDPGLSSVMDALEYLLPISAADTKRLLQAIAPQVHHVLSYTDGKGTRHVLAQADGLLAQLDSGALLVKYREHAELGDWSEAQESLSRFVQSVDATSDAARALLRTGLHPAVIESLREDARGGNENAARMLAEVEQHRGADVGEFDDDKEPRTSSEWKPFAGDIKTYGVAELDRLLGDLKENFGIRGDVLRDWYVYWESQGLGSELIRALEPRLLSDACRDDDLVELIDLGFATKRRLEGGAPAFAYLVQAQLFGGGWMGPSFARTARSEERLRLVVKHYKRRCDEFFLKSAYSWLDYPRKNRVIPGEIMVFFLGLQGRTAEAVQYAEAMVQSVRDDTRTLNLAVPAWAAALAAGAVGASA